MISEATKTKYRGPFLGTFFGMLYALICGLAFTTAESYSIAAIEFVSLAMLLVTPVSVGVITVFFGTAEQAANSYYRSYYPWLSLFGWALVSLVTAWETLICIVMLLPLYLPLATLGGALGGYIRRNYCNKTNQGFAASFAFLPFLMIPIESPFNTPTVTHTVTDTIIIDSSTENVWAALPDILNIKPEELSWTLSHFIGLPRPVSAQTPALELGALRELYWEKGVHFQERITEIIPGKKLAYDVLVDQESMKLAELDNHIVVGDKYFDIVSGQYDLETKDGVAVLSLSTTYRMTTKINWYGKVLANFVLDDFHTAVLELLKKRLEEPNAVS